MVTALEQFIVKVRNLSFPVTFESLHEFVSKSTTLLMKNINILDDVLETLDVQEHSIGVLAVLTVKFNMPNIPEYDAQFFRVQEFINNCNGEQVRFAPDMFVRLCHLVTSSLIERQQYIRGIPLLIKAIQKIQLFPSQLTTIHAYLCQLCLLSKCMKPALQFLDIDVTDINKEKGTYDTKNFLLYYYYGGMIYTSLKNYERALYFYEVAITTPSMAVSHIMLEAYKKYILVSLILYGRIPNLPKFTSQVVGRFIKPLSQAYHDLAVAYSSNSPIDVRAAITKHNEVFVRDNNMGLVKQCMSFLYKKNIQRLTKTFLTLSLTDMANRVQLSGPQEAEFYVLKMIEDGQIFASINQKDGMVVFLDNPEKYNSPAMFQHLEDEMKKCISLDEKLRQMDQEITINSKYIQKSSEMRDTYEGTVNISSDVNTQP
ncbi:COP9 signalosome complex subunit 3 isoform X2 [Parasteatoda tepidariorum]|uniref:COP9 signalosome complex subunit 3 isoform X2 n=1 Tax=Parasteatoda tepidariorum TaxID=114398 RepID=UPI00077FAA92|nr:COP9 signalosome complex subunit 3 isoform X2 [Parasteatoda tepidariorum]